MIYIVTALRIEAQAIVEKYRLQKDKLHGFTIFTNRDILVIVSGIGISNSKKATAQLLESFVYQEDDIFINIGICGAKTKFEVGKLLEITHIEYMDKLLVIGKDKRYSIRCLDVEATDDRYDIVDMESFGFCEALKKVKNVKIFKVVSDNFEPQLVNKDKTKQLIFEIIDKVMEMI